LNLNQELMSNYLPLLLTLYFLQDNLLGEIFYSFEEISVYQKEIYGLHEKIYCNEEKLVNEENL
jgi:hypothetical protein